MEVSYIDMSDKEISTVLTSYAARPSEHDAVVAHFERYKEASSGVFNLSLVIKS